MNTYTTAADVPQTTNGETAAGEGPVARAIEKRTARIPSDLFLWAAGASILGSLVLEVTGMKRRRTARGLFGYGKDSSEPLAGFVGMWAPTLLLLGIYNKIVKVAGSDRVHH